MRLGIDFGTTRTVVALCDDGNYPVVQFLDADGELQEGYPSVIAARGGELRFGWSALACADQEDWTILPSFKRLLSSGYQTPVVLGAGSAPVTPQSLLLSFLVSLREALLSGSNLPASLRADPVLEAIVATPAHADSSQRFVTLEAFRQAGFQVAGMMNEPSAAGVEYAGRYRSTLSGRREKVVVYDLGGGTFDASLVHLSDHRHDVLASAGLPRLGGDDFDAVLVSMALEAAGLEGASLGAASQGRLRLHCRQLKEGLHPNTRRLMVEVGAALTAEDRGRLEASLSSAVPVDCVVDVGAYYERCRPLIEETLSVLQPLLEADPDGLEGIAGLYVVGGASALPVVGRILKERYGRRVHRSLNPTAATAVGLARAFAERETFTVQDRLSRSFGVFREAAGGERVAFDLLVDADQALPATGETRTIVRRYRPVHTLGHLRYVECAGLDAEGAPRGDVSLYAEVFAPYAPDLRGLSATALAAVPVARFDGPGPLIEERYTLDANGIIHLSIVDVAQDAGISYRVTSASPSLVVTAEPSPAPAPVSEAAEGAEEGRVARARALAIGAHGDQRYGDGPYAVHLAATVAILAEQGITDEEVLAAAWLHDALEDTALTAEAVVAAVGARVAAMVVAVSDGPGENRTARKAQPYRLIPQTPGAVLVKLADRIANVASAIAERPGLLEMYRREQATFRERLWDPADAEAAPLWARLEGLLR